MKNSKLSKNELSYIKLDLLFNYNTNIKNFDTILLYNI